jgi:hypothetical protein
MIRLLSMSVAVNKTVFYQSALGALFLAVYVITAPTIMWVMLQF